MSHTGGTRPRPGASYNLAVGTVPDGPGGDLLVRGATLADWERGASPEDRRLRRDRRVDVRIVAGRIAAVEPEIRPLRTEEVMSVPDAVVVPGLHDHHLHLRALVAAARSVAVGPADVGSLDELRSVLARAPVDRRGWRRAVGYHESVAGDLDRWRLDALAPGPPLRVQHRSGAMWVLSSAGVDALGLDQVDLGGVERDEAGRPTGRLVRMDDWLARRLGGDDPVADIASTSGRLAAFGVTGVTDATPHATAQGVGALVQAVADGRLVQRLHLMCPPGLPLAPHPLVTRGPFKVMLDDDGLPALDDLVLDVRRAHDASVPVAFHCVTLVQLTLALAALRAAGSRPGDRIEHAAVVPSSLVDELAATGVTVVTNPGFVHDRGDVYLDTVDERDRPHLYPCASLLSGGVPVAAGTDAPFGADDPWGAVHAARTRRTRCGRSVGPEEAVSLGRAIGLFTGHAARPASPRRLAVGEPGDLCLLSEGTVPGPGQAPAVVATVVAGRVVFGPS
jgi:predicted amidohydrolase YtcJ